MHQLSIWSMCWGNILNLLSENLPSIMFICILVILGERLFFTSCQLLVVFYHQKHIISSCPVLNNIYEFSVIFEIYRNLLFNHWICCLWCLSLSICILCFNLLILICYGIQFKYSKQCSKSQRSSRILKLCGIGSESPISDFIIA